MRLDERCCGLMLVLLGRGRSCHSIARELGGSPSTVRKVAVEAGMVLLRGRVGGVGGLNRASLQSAAASAAVWSARRFVDSGENLSLFEHVR